MFAFPNILFQAFKQRYDVPSTKTNEYDNMNPDEYSSLSDHGSDAILTKDVKRKLLKKTGLANIPGNWPSKPRIFSSKYHTYPCHI